MSSHFDSESMLSPEDVSVDQHQSPSLLCVKLECSKTDPFRAGVAIFLGSTDNVLCPAVLAYLAIRPQAPGPLFVFKDGSYLTRERLVAHLHVGLRQAGLEADRYSRHSFRIGAATTAAQAEVKDSLSKCWDVGSLLPISVILSSHPKRPTSSHFIPSSLFAVVLKLSV